MRMSREFEAHLKETLIINDWNSTCGHCGEGCDYTSKKHDLLVDLWSKPGSPGCGVTWKYVTSGYSDIMNKLPDLRPDLTVKPFTPILDI